MDIERWANSLWAFLIDRFQINVPLFLSVDRHIIHQLAQGHSSGEQIGEVQANHSFQRACASRISVTRTKAQIDEGVFEVGAEGRSLAICFAVQQILAAELMISDDSGSADSYFVRYRQMLGVDPSIGSSPVRYPQFVKIWETLRHEILSIPGSTPTQITFGPGSGKNKNRAYPISQALLNQESLVNIFQLAPTIKQSSDQEILHKIRRISPSLPKQARSKVYVDSISADIVLQIRSFASDIPSTSVKSITDSSPKAEIEYLVYIADDGWNDEYRIDIAQGDIDYAREDVMTALASRIRRDGVVGFKNGAIADFEQFDWNRESTDLVTLLVLREANIDVLRTMFGAIPSESVLRVETTNLPPEYVMLRTQGLELAVSYRQREGQQRDRIELRGGILIDRQRHIYLVGYPPTGIQLGELDVKPQSTIRANGKSWQVSEFLLHLSVQKEAVDFRIEFNNHETRFGISGKSDEHLDSLVGHEIRDGVVGLSVVDLAESQSSLKYLTSFVSSAEQNTLKLNADELTRYLCTPLDQWVRSSSTLISKALFALESVLSNEPSSRYLIQKVSEHQSIPPAIHSIMSRESRRFLR